MTPLNYRGLKKPSQRIHRLGSMLVKQFRSLRRFVLRRPLLHRCSREARIKRQSMHQGCYQAALGNCSQSCTVKVGQLHPIVLTSSVFSNLQINLLRWEPFVHDVRGGKATAVTLRACLASWCGGSAKLSQFRGFQRTISRNEGDASSASGSGWQEWRLLGRSWRHVRLWRRSKAILIVFWCYRGSFSLAFERPCRSKTRCQSRGAEADRDSEFAQRKRSAHDCSLPPSTCAIEEERLANSILLLRNSRLWMQLTSGILRAFREDLRAVEAPWCCCVWADCRVDWRNCYGQNDIECRDSNATASPKCLALSPDLVAASSMQIP